jgi:hypothetical protein
MFKNTLILTFALFNCAVYAQDSNILIPAGEQVVQNDFQDLVWNRYTTENFTILSIENKQGRWLYYNIENIKSWCLKRWGLPNIKFEKECRVMVVPNKELLKKLFNISEPRYEARMVDGKLEIIALWLSLDADEDLVDTVPYFVTICSMLEIDQKFNTKSNIFLTKGMAELNRSLVKIKDNIRTAATVEGKDIVNSFAVDNIKYKKMSPEDSENFDSKALIASLMLRKEFGENKFLRFLFSNKNANDSLGLIYNFNSESFVKSYTRYCKDLASEIKDNKVPDFYLQVEKR